MIYRSIVADFRVLAIACAGDYHDTILRGLNADTSKALTFRVESHNPLRRQQIIRRILERFEEKSIIRSSLSFRKPCFEGHRIRFFRYDRPPANDGVWCLSVCDPLSTIQEELTI